MPFEDLTGGTGFTSDSEGAEANLNINMSDDSARTLWDVQAAVQQIATDFQTAVRAAADFQSYLISIRETSQTVRMPSLGMEGGEGGNMSYAGGRVDTGSVPLIQSEISQAQRIGEMEENSTGDGGGALGARSPGRSMDPDQLASQMTNMAFLGSMGGSHGGQGSREIASAYEREYDYALANSRLARVQNARHPGAPTGSARAYAASQIIRGGLPGATQFLGGGGAGGIAASLGRLGIVGAVGYAGYQVVDAALETYAQSRTRAMAVNNSEFGTGSGFATRADQAVMSMSPFVSQEEAASIYENAINMGWASRRGGFDQGDFSQAVNFMYGAAKDYNMSPDQAAQVLQTNAMGAGQSIQALAEQLATLKKSLDGTGVSMSVANGVFQQYTSFLIGAGANPADAARIAGGAINSYADNSYLGPSGAGAMSDLMAMQNPQLQAILGGVTGNFPSAVFAEGNSDKGIAAYQNLIHTLAVQASSQTGMSIANRAAMFAQSYKAATGQQLDQRMAEQKMMEAAASPDWYVEGQNKIKSASQMKLEEYNGLERWWHGLDDIGGAAHGVSKPGGAVSLESEEENAAKINTYRFFSPQVNTLLDNSGDNLKDVILYGPDGKPVMVDGHRVAGANIAKWFNSRENYNKFNDPNSGLYIEDQSGTKYHSYDIAMGGDSGGVTANGATEANTVYITLSDQAKQWFATDKSSIPFSDGKNN